MHILLGVEYEFIEAFFQTPTRTEQDEIGF
jgi:hypothetical protein